MPTAPRTPAATTAARPARPLRRLLRRVWLRVLTPGGVAPAPADRLRGLARYLDWMEAGGAARRRLVRRALWTPVREWRLAGVEARRTGADIAAVAGVSPAVQRWQRWWLALRHGVLPPTYVEYQLYRPERRRRAAGYVQEPEHTRILRWLHRRDGDPDAAIFRDKRGFAAWCAGHGFPHVATLAEFDEGRVERGDPAALPPADLFSKPNAATSAHGVERWRFVGTAGAPRWRGGDGRERTAGELFAELAGLSRTLELREGRRSRRMLLQPCLRNHRALLDLTTGALCTVRVLVYRAPEGASAVVRAAYRLAVGSAAADNYAVGGIVAPVDVATGRLQAAARREGGLLRPVERHPDTGAAIAGRELPCWPETLALCLRGIDAAPRMPTIGWDVAITDDGPVLIEGNMAPNPGLVQKTSGLPLGDTPLPAAIERHLRRRLDL